MKKSAWIIAIIALTISACTSQKHATSYVDDDVYNSSAQPAQTVTTPSPSANQGAQVVTSPDKASAQKPVSSTFEDDYNDYSYSNRINRFSNKDTTIGYFNDPNAGSASVGNQGANDANVNIYLGYSSGYDSFYGPSYSFGMGWGYPYSNWGWDYGWGYPYYGGYYGWGFPYYYGGYSPWYDPWYNPCCYCYGYNDWYAPYNSTDYYYGSRKSLYRTDGGAAAPNERSAANYAGNASNTRNAINAGNASSRIEQGDVTPSPRTTQQSGQNIPASQEK
jgi:hypothetical protein